MRSLLLLAPFVIWACDDTNPPSTGAGNKVTTNFPDAEPSQDQREGTGDGGQGSAYGEGGSNYSYSPQAVCAQCACGPGTYCFGGGTGFTTFSGTCTPTGSTLSVGCQPLPAGCSSCGCIFDALKGHVPCYLVCGGTGPLTVYCPSP
jgi:hypothetical protein